MICGIGVDVVSIERFERSLTRTPALRSRLFTQSEQALVVRSLAVRFAAKEALIKALGDSTGFTWHQMEVVDGENGKPFFRCFGAVAELLTHRAIDAVHLSLSHDGDTACAFVVVEAQKSGRE